MKLEQRIEAFDKLSYVFERYLKNSNDEFSNIIKNAVERLHYSNPWFIKPFVDYQIENIAQNLKQVNLENWLAFYKIDETTKPKKIGIVMAGNIPFVGFHDLLCVLITGNIAKIKPSSKDNILPQLFAFLLTEIEPQFAKYIHFENDKLSNFDAVIAAGSDNTARYFEQYFGQYPHIIRRNRTSVAVLTGNETPQELSLLADDILLYFGLGCRNVSKIFIPKNYDLNLIFNALYKYSFINTHNKYMNNYEYNRAIYLLNKTKFLENGFFIIKEDTNLVSPVSVLFYEYYNEINEVIDKLQSLDSKIQSIVSSISTLELSVPLYDRIFKLGEAQKPGLNDYEDGIDTIDFLLNL